jgi:hypothetical protein
MDESPGYTAGYLTLPEKRIRRGGLEHGRYLAMMFNEYPDPALLHRGTTLATHAYLAVYALEAWR